MASAAPCRRSLLGLVLGVPFRVVVGKKLNSGMVELVERKTRQSTDVTVEEAADRVRQCVG